MSTSNSGEVPAASDLKVYFGIIGLLAANFEVCIKEGPDMRCNLKVMVVRRRLIPVVDLLHTPEGVVGPCEPACSTSATNPDDFNGWVVGFHGEWSDGLAKLPTTSPRRRATCGASR